MRTVTAQQVLAVVRDVVGDDQIDTDLAPALAADAVSTASGAQPAGAHELPDGSGEVRFLFGTPTDRAPKGRRLVYVWGPPAGALPKPLVVVGLNPSNAGIARGKSAPNGILTDDTVDRLIAGAPAMGFESLIVLNLNLPVEHKASKLRTSKDDQALARAIARSVVTALADAGVPVTALAVWGGAGAKAGDALRAELTDAGLDVTWVRAITNAEVRGEPYAGPAAPSLSPANNGNVSMWAATGQVLPLA